MFAHLHFTPRVDHMLDVERTDAVTLLFTRMVSERLLVLCVQHYAGANTIKLLSVDKTWPLHNVISIPRHLAGTPLDPSLENRPGTA